MAAATTEGELAPWETLEFATVSHHANGGIDFSKSVVHDEGLDSYGRPTTQMQRSESSDDLFVGLNENVPVLKELAHDAKAAAFVEHNMTVRQALRLYPKAIFWSILLSFTIVMEGYDVSLISAFFAFPAFKERYGQQLPNGNWELSTSWQTGLGSGALVGEILGLFWNGTLTEKLGYRKTMVGSLCALCCFVFLSFFAHDKGMLLAYQVLCGLSWGVFQTLSTTYAADVMPVALRAYLTSTVNMCWLVGQLIAAGVIRGVVNNTSEWSYRIPFALQWVWAVPIAVGIFFAPESPWWLVRHGQYDKAEHVLRRLTSKGMNFDAAATVNAMRHTNEVEKYLSAGTSYLDCFKGTDLRRTEIASVVWMAQTFSGSPLTGFSAYFFVQGGLNPEHAFDLSTGMYGLAIVAGICAFFVMPHVGRRTLYLWGLGLSFPILMITGAVGTQGGATWVSWTLGGLVLVLTFVYDFTLGPVCYALVAEIPSTRLRVKTVILARISYNLVGLVSNILMPKMLNPSAWDWGGKTAFLWAGTCLLCFIWAYIRLPEPKGLTYVEMDILFEKRAAAKKFREFQVNLAATGYFSVTSSGGEAVDGHTAEEGDGRRMSFFKRKSSAGRKFSTWVKRGSRDIT